MVKTDTSSARVLVSAWSGDADRGSSMGYHLAHRVDGGQHVVPSALRQHIDRIYGFPEFYLCSLLS